MMPTVDETPIQALSEEWWAEQLKFSGCNQRQGAFARAHFENPGLPRYKVAAQVGVPGDERSLRSESSRLYSNPKVKKLLELAALAKADQIKPGLKGADHYLGLLSEVAEKSTNENAKIAASRVLLEYEARLHGTEQQLGGAQDDALLRELCDLDMAIPIPLFTAGAVLLAETFGITNKRLWRPPAYLLNDHPDLLKLVKRYVKNKSVFDRPSQKASRGNGSDPSRAAPPAELSSHRPRAKPPDSEPQETAWGRGGFPGR